MTLEDMFTMGQALATSITAAAGAVLSLAFYLIPPFKKWYDSKPDEWKPVFMAVAVLLVTVVVGALDFTNVIDLIPNNVYGIITLMIAWFTGMTANQITYQTFIKQRKQ